MNRCSCERDLLFYNKPRHIPLYFISAARYWRKSHAKDRDGFSYFRDYRLWECQSASRSANRPTRVKWQASAVYARQSGNKRAGTNSMRPIEASSAVAGIMAGSRCTQSLLQLTESCPSERRAEYDEKSYRDIIARKAAYCPAQRYDRAKRFISRAAILERLN